MTAPLSEAPIGMARRMLRAFGQNTVSVFDSNDRTSVA